ITMKHKGTHLAIEGLIKDAANGPWPWSELSRLRFDQSRVKADQATALLGRIVACRAWRLPLCEMNVHAFVELGRHFESLEEVDLGLTESVDSHMVQDILESCPRLLTFRGPKVDARDIVNGGPWVCRSLRSMKLLFDVAVQASAGTSLQSATPAASSSSSPKVAAITVISSSSSSPSSSSPSSSSPSSSSSSSSASSSSSVSSSSSSSSSSSTAESSTANTLPVEVGRQVLQRIGALAALEELDVGSDSGFVDGVPFTLEGGLDALGALRHLSVLRFARTEQHIGRPDLSWMLDTWSQLKVIDGVLDQDDVEQSKSMADSLKLEKNSDVLFSNRG
ncbi:hypothetical protein BGX27_002807, partial [Mortierella sp. AM989]